MVVSRHDSLDGSVALVTGGAGFIGSALCAELTRLGATVHSVNRREHGPPGTVRHWCLDLTDAAGVRQLVHAARPDYVFHLASHVQGAPGLKHVLPAFHSNLHTTINLYCALVETGCRRVITAGSLVEPDPDTNHRVPNSPYAAAKWASSDYTRMFHALYNLNAAIARVFMVYGPAQQDEFKLVPYTIRCLQRGEAPKITSGRHSFDWVFVDDVVVGLLKIATASSIAGETVDLGTGVTTTTVELVDTLCDLMNSQVRPEYGALPDRPIEPLRIARVDDAQRAIGFTAKVGLREGLRRSIEWYEAHRE